MGYDQHDEITVTRQISIGGKSKYFINGKVSPANQVANLFHSVQLNVNNPHFLIMQGRITKVLNMKPHEILGMVEEAAGTRMYENKKIAAIKTIEKKQKKVDEITDVLSKEIEPTLRRLRNEKESYLTWSKNKADIERKERFVVAHSYMKAQEALEKNELEDSQMEESFKAKEKEVEEHKLSIEQNEMEIEELSQKLNGEFGKAHKELKSSEEKLSKELVKITSSWQNSVSTVAKAKDDLEAASDLAAETKNAVELKQSEISNDSTGIGQAQQEAKDAEMEARRLTTEYQNMCAGISSEDSGEGMTLPDQINKAHSDANTADAKAKQAEMKINHLQKSIKVSSHWAHVVSAIPLFDNHLETWIIIINHLLLHRL